MTHTIEITGHCATETEHTHT